MYWIKSVLLELESERYSLRSMTVAHVSEAYVYWWNDRRIQEPMNNPPRNATRASLVKFVSGFDNLNSFHLGIFRKGGGDQPIGFVSIFVKPVHSVATINIVVGDKSYWGSGVPKAVMPMVLDFVFDTLQLAKVCTEVAGCNRSSLALCRRLEFVCEGVLRSHRPRVGGGRVDIHQYGLLREEWQAKKNGQAIARME